MARLTGMHGATDGHARCDWRRTVTDEGDRRGGTAKPPALRRGRRGLSEGWWGPQPLYGSAFRIVTEAFLPFGSSYSASSPTLWPMTPEPSGDCGE